MNVFAISDLHLAFAVDKPMDIFGENWEGYENKILENWNAAVTEADIGIIAGDISWAMRMEEAKVDFEYLAKLCGIKIIIRGNHDYWWSTISKVRENLPPNVIALQNDSVRLGSFVFCGTRGWKVPERRATQSNEDRKIFEREVLRFEMSLKDAKKRAQPGDTLVAIMHYPPFNSSRDESPFMLLAKNYGVAKLVYGHLHGKGGRTDHEFSRDGVTYVLSSCDKVDFDVVKLF